MIQVEAPPAAASRARLRTDFLLLTLLVLLIRLPFLNQAIGGDEPYYLAAAYHAQIDPAHPNHATYVFEGREVTFQGYPHPPGNAWLLAALVALFGDAHEVAFHAAYLPFSLAAVWLMYALARRFSPAPFWAAALFAVVPAFVVSGNTLESDLPLLAFWMAGAAAFVYAVDRRSGRLLPLAAVALACSALIAMQSIVFSAILLAYLWARRERWTPARVLVALAPVIILIGWQLFERVTSGVFPAQVAQNYIASYGYARLAIKLRNVVGLTIELLFMIFPVVLPSALRALRKRRADRDVRFLLVWIAVFLVSAWILFYAGSARYLLPIAAPLAILMSFAPLRLVWVAFGVQLVISIGLAAVNFEQWNAYRSFAEALRETCEQNRVYVDAEWGLRHYFEADGALPFRLGQRVASGDFVIQSALAYPAQVEHGGELLVPVREMDIDPRIPLRTIGLTAASGFSTVSAGFLPYDFRGGLIDRVTAYSVRKARPELFDLQMGAPASESQIVSGMYQAEGGAWRWMGAHAVLLLKNPGRPATLFARFYVADQAPARNFTLGVEGGPSKTLTVPGPGSYTIELPENLGGSEPLTVGLSADKTFAPPGDNRQLGVILNEVGVR